MSYMNKILSTIFIISAFLVIFTFEGPCFITGDVDKYKDCRDKEPTDKKNEYCCYLKAKISGKEEKYCVELSKGDVDDDKFEKTKETIEKRQYTNWTKDDVKSYYYWYNEDGVTIDKIETFRCKDAKYIKFFGIMSLIFIALLF